MSYNSELDANNVELQEILDAVNNLPDADSIEGENGATFIPHVSDDGVISWTNDKALPNPDPVSIKGKDGTKWHFLQSYDIALQLDFVNDGDLVVDLADERLGVFKVDKANNQMVFTGVYLKGEKGDKGDDGVTPVKGTDYFTDEDKAEMVQAVIASLPTWNGGSY